GQPQLPCWLLGEVQVHLVVGRLCVVFRFFFSSRRRHTRFKCDWSSDVCSSDLAGNVIFVPWLKLVTVVLKMVSVWAMVGSEKVRSEERRVGKECRSRVSA